MKKISISLVGIISVILLTGSLSYGKDACSVGADQNVYGKSDSPYHNKANLGGRLNINTATVEELVMLPGVGEDIAKNIVAFKNANGPFNSIDDLIKIKGVGDKKLDAMRSFIKLEGASNLRVLEP